MKTMRCMMFALACTLAIPSLSQAADTTVGSLVISNPWARASNAQNAAAFLSIRNTGSEDDQLIGVATTVSEKAQLHNHIMEGNVMKMRPVDSIDAAAGATVALQPGGYHVMLIGLKQPLKEGDKVPLTLTFRKAGTVDVEAEVLSAGAAGPAGGAMPGMQGHDMPHTMQMQH